MASPACHAFSPSLCLRLCLSLSLTHTHTHTHSLTLSLSLFCSLTSPACLSSPSPLLLLAEGCVSERGSHGPAYPPSLSLRLVTCEQVVFNRLERLMYDREARDPVLREVWQKLNKRTKEEE